MKTIVTAAAFLALLTSPLRAADPIGEWLVAEKNARITIEQCPNGLWGSISWLKEPALDENNPDKTKRTRSMNGVPILLGMKEGKKPGRWEGEVYNAKNGKIYDAYIQLESDNALRIEGCVLRGMICQGETWTRVAKPPEAPPPSPPARRNVTAPPPPAPARNPCPAS